MKTLIFDFDGTIADSFETLLDIFNEISGRPQKLTATEVTGLRGKTLKEIIRYLKIKNWQIPRLILRGKRLIGARITDIDSFAGIATVLRQLHESGHKMYIVSTNSESNIREFLANDELENYFKKIYGDIGLRSKSSVIKKIIRKERLDRSSCFYIGDEVRDVEAARKALVTSVGVTWGFNTPAAIMRAKPEVIAHQPRDLLKLPELAAISRAAASGDSR